MVSILSSILARSASVNISLRNSFIVGIALEESACIRLSVGNTHKGIDGFMGSMSICISWASGLGLVLMGM